MPEENENENQEDPNESKDLRVVREAWKREQKARKAAETTAAETPNLARENAMLRAGVDLDTPLGQLFADGYKGELDKDAIKAAFGNLGVSPTSGETNEPDPNADQPSAEELARQQREQALSNGGTPPGGEPDEDPYIAAMAAYHDAGGNQTNAARVAGLQKIFDAAAAGDARVTATGPLDRETRDAWTEQHNTRMRRARDMQNRTTSR